MRVGDPCGQLARADSVTFGYAPGMRDDDVLVTIAVFDNSFDAAVARGALEGLGIRALVPEEALFRRGVVVTPGTLQVLERDEARARVELHRLQIRVVEPEN